MKIEIQKNYIAEKEEFVCILIPLGMRIKVLPPLSPAASNCPPDTFLPSLRSGRPFKSPIDVKKPDTPNGVSGFLKVVT